MEHSTHTPQPAGRMARIPPIVWFLGAGLIAGLIAVFAFNVAVSTVVYYGFFALMIGGHFFMHGSHGGHGNHAAQSNKAETTTPDPNKKDQPASHSGGCH